MNLIVFYSKLNSNILHDLHVLILQSFVAKEVISILHKTVQLSEA
jgi:hypothetical protein